MDSKVRVSFELTCSIGFYECKSFFFILFWFETLNLQHLKKVFYKRKRRKGEFTSQILISVRKGVNKIQNAVYILKITEITLSFESFVR